MYWHALDEDGYLWFWGQDVYGCGGVGMNSHTSQGTLLLHFQEELKLIGICMVV